MLDLYFALFCTTPTRQPPREDYQAILTVHGMMRSMSRRGATVQAFTGTTCSAEPVPVLPGIGLAAMGLLLGGFGTGILLRRARLKVR